MERAMILMGLALALAACAQLPQRPPEPPSPCVASEVSYDCQVERYNNVNVD